MVDGAVKEKAGFNMADVVPENAAKECDCPAFFLHGSEDNFIVPEHSEKNFAAYGGTNKVIKKCAGDHNSPRPDDMI